MNDEKKNAPDDVIKSCDAIIDETQKNLANAYYFRAARVPTSGTWTAPSAIMASRSASIPTTPIT
jgi:hypothetical protein